MKKNPAFISGISLSGGIAGTILFLACSHLNDRLLNVNINPYFLFISIAFFSVLFPAGWLVFSAFFIKTFNADPVKTVKDTGLIFMTSVPAALGLIPLFLFYGKIAAAKLKVVGYIYLPFINYLHVNPAGYYLFSLFGFILITISSLLLFKFAYFLYNSPVVIDERRKTLMIFVSLFLFFCVTTTYVTIIYPPTGDEPHYLTISQSMANDLDLNLENNYTEGKYKEFYPVDIDYKSIHNTVDKNGKGIYSLHFPGLPAMIAALQRVSGRLGVQLFMNFITAALAAVFFIFLRKNHITEKVSLAAVFIFFTAMPFSAAASLVMTETPAALIILYAVMKLYQFNKDEGSLILFSGIVFLPWLHPKMVVFSVVFFIWYYLNVMLKKSFNLKKEALNSLILIFSLALMVILYYCIFGKFAPFAITSIYKTPGSYFDFSLKHALKSVLAIIFDRDFGFLVYAPVYITAFFGLAYTLIKDGTKKIIPFTACIPYLVMFIFWNDWGGSMYPARQILPVLAVAVYYAAYFMQDRNFLKKKFFKFLAAASMVISYVLMIVPSLRYLSGREKIYSVIEKFKCNILWFFPSFSDVISFHHLIIVLYTFIILFLFFKYAEMNKK